MYTTLGSSFSSKSLFYRQACIDVLFCKLKDMPIFQILSRHLLGVHYVASTSLIKETIWGCQTKGSCLQQGEKVNICEQMHVWDLFRECWVLEMNKEGIIETWEDPLMERATHSGILAWEVPWQRSLAGYSPWCHRIRRHSATKQQTKIN